MSGEFSLDSLRVEELEKELEENPFNIGAHSELAQHYASKCDYTSACKHYEKIVRVNEENGKAWTALGHCYLLKGEYQKCFTAYQKALYTMEDNRDPQLWYGIGLLYHKFESYEFAEPAYLAVLRIDPNFEQKHEVLYKLGLIYKKTNAFENAVINLKGSIACQAIPAARKVDAYCHIGVCYEKLGKLDEALQVYQEALTINPQNFKTLEFISWVLFLKHDYTSSTTYLSKALEVASDNSAEVGDIHYLLGRAYLEMENFSEGQNSFQRAIYKNPNAYLYWSSIGILYARAMQPQDAFECFVKASNISQDDGDVWFNMAVLYEQCNQKQEAILAYQRALSLNGSNALAAERKGKLQWNEELGTLPSYVHPLFELSEVPFSIKKNEKATKQMKSLPDINNIKKEKVQGEVLKEDSDEEYEEEEEKSGESESKESSPYSPCGVGLRSRVIAQKATRSFTHSQVIEEPRRCRTLIKTPRDTPQSKKTASETDQPPQKTTILSKDKPLINILDPTPPQNVNSGFIPSLPTPDQSTQYPQMIPMNRVSQVPNAPFIPLRFPSSATPSQSPSSISTPNKIINPLGPIPSSTASSPVTMKYAKSPPGMENLFSNIPQSTGRFPPDTTSPNPYLGPVNLAKTTPGMEFYENFPQTANNSPQPPVSMTNFGLPNMPMLMGMMPNMVPSSMNNNNYKQGQQAFNAYQMALQNMILSQMSGMMNPMMGLMNMRMMGNKAQGPISKRDSEEDLAETLTKMNESMENDEDGLRKKRKGDKSKDLTIKKRKK